MSIFCPASRRGRHDVIHSQIRRTVSVTATAPDTAELFRRINKLERPARAHHDKNVPVNPLGSVTCAVREYEPPPASGALVIRAPSEAMMLFPRRIRAS